MKHKFSAIFLSLFVLAGFAFSITYIDHCQDLTIPNEEYRLTADVTANSDTCFEIMQSGITLDCQGHSARLTGGGGYGVFASNQNGIQVRNCRLENWWTGIDFRSISNGELSNNVAKSNEDYGFYLESSSHITIRNNTALYNGESGFVFFSSNQNVLTNNTATNNNYGFSLSSSNSNILANNAAYSNKEGGFHLAHFSSNNILTKNIIKNNANPQIKLSDSSSSNLFFHNNITGDIWVADNSGQINRFDTGEDNEFDLGSEGNIYYFTNGTPSWGVYDIPDGIPENNWADAGSDRPFDSHIAEWEGGNKDWHPYTGNDSENLTCAQASYPACFANCSDKTKLCSNTISFEDNSDNCLCDCPAEKGTILNVSEQISSGKFKVRLSSATDDNAYVDILDENGNVIATAIRIGESDYYTYTDSNGYSITFRVIRSTLNSSGGGIARAATYSKEIILQDGRRFNLVSADDLNKYSKVTLLWKNRDYSSNSQAADSLREIVVWDTESFDNKKMSPGDSYEFIPEPKTYKLKYLGLDLVSFDYEQLSISNNGNRSIFLCSGVSGSWDCATRNGSAQGYLLKVSASDSEGFGGSGILGTDRTNTIYIDPIGIYTNSSAQGHIYSVHGEKIQNTAYLGQANMPLYPTIFWRGPTDVYFKYKIIGGVASLDNVSSNLGSRDIAFDSLGSDYGAKGLLHISLKYNTSTILSYSGYYDSDPAQGAVLQGEIVIQEDAGKANLTSHARVWTRVPIFNLTSREWRFKPSNIATAYAYYGGINLANTGGSSTNTPLIAEGFEPSVYTERGSKITSIFTTSYSFSAARRVAKAVFEFENSHQFSSLISDYIDKTPGNREYKLSEDYYKGKTDYTTRSDVSERLTPLRSTDIAIQELYMIGSDQFSGFAPVSVLDTLVDATYTEEQAFWVGGRTNGYMRESTSVYYDSNSAYRSIVARPKAVAYSLTFRNNDFGIPECTVKDSNGDWSSCTKIIDRTDNHRLEVEFMKESWIISKLDRRSATISNGQGSTNGGIVKLAQEIEYGEALEIGDTISGNYFSFRVKEILSNGNVIFDVLDGSEIVGTIQVSPGDTYTFIQGSTGNSDMVHLYNSTYLGLQNEEWAEIRTYGPCPQGQVYNVTSCKCEGDILEQNLTCEESFPACGGYCENEKKECTGSSVGCACECSNKIDEILNIGDSMENTITKIRIRLIDVSTAEGDENTHPAIFDVYVDGILDGQIRATPPAHYTYTTKDGRTFKFKLLKTATGFTNSSKWAEVLFDPPCPKGEIFNETTCSCEPILQPLTFSCSQNFTQNRSYIKNFDYCQNDCPSIKLCNAGSCKCECNQTQMAACVFPNIWHEGNCTCEEVFYCGGGSDAGICTLPCQNENKQCILNSPASCSCECQNETACKDPKTFNNQTCSCLCPAQDTERIYANQTIEGGKYDLRILKMGENNGAEFANIEIRGKDGSHKWWYSLTEGESKSYYNYEGKDGISFTIIEINADEGWVEIMIYPDCPTPKKYSPASCVCYCPSELKNACKYPDTWHEQNCTCEKLTHDTCKSSFSNGSLICGGICLNSSEICMLKPIGLVADQNWSLPNVNGEIDQNADLSNLTPINGSEEVSFCSCQPKPKDTCDFIENPYSSELGEPYYSTSACTGLCKNPKKKCHIAGFPLPVGAPQIDAYLDASCLCTCGFPNTLTTIDPYIRGYGSIAEIDIKNASESGVAIIYLGDGRNLSNFKFEQARAGDTISIDLSSGGTAFFNILKVSSQNGTGYVIFLVGECPIGSIYDFENCTCINATKPQVSCATQNKTFNSSTMECKNDCKPLSQTPVCDPKTCTCIPLVMIGTGADCSENSGLNIFGFEIIPSSCAPGLICTNGVCTEQLITTRQPSFTYWYEK